MTFLINMDKGYDNMAFFSAEPMYPSWANYYRNLMDEVKDDFHLSVTEKHLKYRDIFDRIINDPHPEMFGGENPRLDVIEIDFEEWKQKRDLEKTQALYPTPARLRAYFHNKTKIRFDTENHKSKEQRRSW
ncbi:MAG: hypothetical protein H7831_16200 [Magnetococcus sp. WYHC-3]